MVDGISSTQPAGLLPAGHASPIRNAALQSAPAAVSVSAGGDRQQTGSAVVGTGQQPGLATGNTLLAAQQAGGSDKPKAPGELSDEEKQQVAKLKQIDAKVHAHERAHAAVGGQYAGAPHYSYTRGPDGQQYATGGEVGIDIGPERDPEATLQKAAQVQAAALAPADPSGQDRAVAAAAAQLRLQALAQIREQKQAEQAAQQGSESQSSAGNSAGGTSAPAAGGAPGPETPAARASRAYANDNAGLNRLVGQVVGISA